MHRFLIHNFNICGIADNQNGFSKFNFILLTEVKFITNRSPLTDFLKFANSHPMLWCSSVAKLSISLCFSGENQTVRDWLVGFCISNSK